VRLVKSIITKLQNKEVADKVGTSREKISDIIDKCGKNCKDAEYDKTLNFTPFLFNLWNSQKDNSITHL